MVAAEYKVLPTHSLIEAQQWYPRPIDQEPRPATPELSPHGKILLATIDHAPAGILALDALAAPNGMEAVIRALEVRPEYRHRKMPDAPRISNEFIAFACNYALALQPANPVLYLDLPHDYITKELRAIRLSSFDFPRRESHVHAFLMNNDFQFKRTDPGLPGRVLYEYTRPITPKKISPVGAWATEAA